jgi:hypothetical protein
MGTTSTPTKAEDSAAEFFTNRVFMGMFAPAPRSNGGGSISASGSSAGLRGSRTRRGGRWLYEGSRGPVPPRAAGPFLPGIVESWKGACPERNRAGSPPVIPKLNGWPQAFAGS